MSPELSVYYLENGEEPSSYTFRSQYPTKKLGLLKKLMGLRKPLPLSNEFEPIWLWMCDKPIAQFETEIKKTIKRIRLLVVPYLKQRHICSIYVPRNHGSYLQMRNNDKNLKSLFKKEINHETRNNNADEFIGLKYSPTIIYIK